MLNFFKRKIEEDIDIDYDYVLNRINEIENRIKFLNNTSIVEYYDINSKAFQSFGGFKLLMLRDREFNESEIKCKKKIFLSQFNILEEYMIMEEEVEYMISYLYSSSYKDIEKKLEDNIDERLKRFMLEIRVFIENLLADDLVINELNDLEEEYKNLLNLKYKYEKTYRR